MNKRLITIFVGLGLIALLLVLNFMLFVVKSVEVEFSSSDYMTEAEIGAAKREIVQASGITEGRSVFSISESKVASNVASSASKYEVTSVERWPNRVVLHVVRRIPIIAIPFYTNGELRYAIVDSMLFVTDIVEYDSLDTEKYAVLETALSGGQAVRGKTLTGFGDEAIQLQNVAVAFQYAGLSPEGFTVFVRTIYINPDKSNMILVTNENISINIDLKSGGTPLTTEELKHRVARAYEWYLQNRDNYTGGQAVYDLTQGKYTWFSA